MRFFAARILVKLFRHPTPYNRIWAVWQASPLVSHSRFQTEAFEILRRGFESCFEAEDEVFIKAIPALWPIDWKQTPARAEKILRHGNDFNRPRHSLDASSDLCSARRARADSSVAFLRASASVANRDRGRARESRPEKTARISSSPRSRPRIAFDPSRGALLEPLRRCFHARTTLRESRAKRARSVSPTFAQKKINERGHSRRWLLGDAPAGAGVAVGKVDTEGGELLSKRVGAGKILAERAATRSETLDSIAAPSRFRSRSRRSFVRAKKSSIGARSKPRTSLAERSAAAALAARAQAASSFFLAAKVAISFPAFPSSPRTASAWGVFKSLSSAARTASRAAKLFSLGRASRPGPLRRSCSRSHRPKFEATNQV